MKLLVLAGGFGKRLQAAVADVPKALAPVGNMPFLYLQIEHWLNQGVRDFTFLLHHKAGQIVDFLQRMQTSSLKECKVRWVIEPMPMDTGGAISYAVRELDLIDDFLITNADTWLGSGIREMMQSPVPAMAVVNLENVSRYGQVHFDERKYVTSFVEKNTESLAGWINAGIYHLSPSFFKDWNGQPFSLERRLFTTLVENRGLVAVPLETKFIDIGVPQDYHRFCEWIESEGKPPL